MMYGIKASDVAFTCLVVSILQLVGIILKGVMVIAWILAWETIKVAYHQRKDIYEFGILCFGVLKFFGQFLYEDVWLKLRKSV